MKIYIENQILEYENNKDEIDNILNEIDTIIAKSSKVLSHIVVDEYEVFEDYYGYFLDNIRVIDKVEVISSTYKELVDDILNSALEYLERTPELIDNLANSFYKNPNQESWKDLEDLLGGISWVINTFSFIDQDERLKDVVLSYKDWNLYAKEVFSLKSILGDFEDSLSNGDNVSIADILSYEIATIFKEMATKLLNLVNKNDSSSNLN
ncbi:hypothetical protein [Tissierella sp.]|uniref:hypothetical protein n=1 Tax=Tissierella sp. TaxID=41274 RepID=UPI00285484E3|nr:hypothetical protein [Tissierella sp.]MDR7856916.1 hypothetical protein [Tissierella sp.]